MLRKPMAVPVPNGAGVACSTARLPRLCEGESVPRLTEGYVETEYLLSGWASGYSGPATGPVTLAAKPTGYVTRLLIRHPMSAVDFSGRVVVEPFNTSFGVDRDALWTRVGEQLQDSGDAWVGVTTRAMGAVELGKLDPVRYADIDLSTNDLAWDVLRDAAVLLRAGWPRSPLGKFVVRWMYLGGYSQSAVEVATFAMAFHDSARLPDGSACYDGYFPAARAASCAAIASGAVWRPPMEHPPMRDVEAPVIEVQPQSDVEGFSAQIGSERFVNPGSASVRRADSDFKLGRYRLYELAGAAHVARLEGCDGSGSSFPTSAFVRAALRLLFGWVEEGLTPPRAARIRLKEIGPVSEARVDRYGNSLGGVRAPHLEVPLARYEAHSNPGPLCQLVGREDTLTAGTLATRYRDAGQYLDEFEAALDETIQARFLLPSDRESLLAQAQAQAREAFASIDYQEVPTP
jgi:hypothetical protein